MDTHDRVFSAPLAGEYLAYMDDYVSLVPDGRVLQHLEQSSRELVAFVRSFPVARLTLPHEPGEWTIQDVLQHVIDTERVFTYRLLRIARGDETPLPGFEQDDYAASAGANARDIEELLREYDAVRRSSVALIRGLRQDVLLRTGTASGHKLSVRAAVYIIAGHERYHLRSLLENYQP